MNKCIYFTPPVVLDHHNAIIVGQEADQGRIGKETVHDASGYCSVNIMF